jgi:hypothetical protein
MKLRNGTRRREQLSKYGKEWQNLSLRSRLLA